MWRGPPASGTPFITGPRAKKKPRGPTEESRPKQSLLVYPRTPPHRQVDAILPAASSTLERASELIDAKQTRSSGWLEMLSLQVPNIIDADDVIACIAYGFIAGSVRLAQYINVPIEALALGDSCYRFSFGVQHRTDCS